MQPEWNTFLSAQAGAAATLTGLVFVAVSINLAKIMEVPGLPGRAAESMFQFMQVFFIAAIALIPAQPERALAIEILCIGLLSWIAQITSQIRYLRVRTGHPWVWFVNRTVLSQFATLPLLVAGAAFFWSAPWAAYWLVPGFIFSFIAGLVSAWVLLVEILR